MKWYVEYTCFKVTMSERSFYIGNKKKSEVGFNLLRSTFSTNKLGLGVVVL